MDETKIYFDYAATTPTDQRVIQSMLPYFYENFGNPSSIHLYGQKAENAIDESREKIANLLNCSPEEIIFTSCGSESDNLAIRGVAFAERKSRQANHILISSVEHHAVSQTSLQLAKEFGFELEFIPVDHYGMIDPDNVKKLIRRDTALVSVIFANNEIGTINPISEIGKICKQYGVPFHTDAVQAAAHLQIDVNSLNVDLLSIGAHKFYGPKGVGLLYRRKGIKMLPTQTGGSQEFGYRAGTHNVPYIVGMATAYAYAQDRPDNRNSRLSTFRDQLISGILEEIDGSELTGHPALRLPNHASFVFKGVDGNKLLMLLDMEGFACSSGSACKTGDPHPSDVLLAIGFSPEGALGSLRVTLGAYTEKNHIEQFLKILPDQIKKVRQMYG
ncbi:MAG: cysteine desulfurase [Chloroflexi bacterium]|nr:cysteine desulfurase [Chloroflexota bacterium]